MFVDTRQLDDGSVIEADVCIIGGGAAGITLALEFDAKGVRTCVLESGGLSADDATRDLYRGENVGLPYKFADGCRSRFLGGSSNCWGGWCRPLDEHDFQRRDWVPHSGWPIAKSDLLPYYERSRSILEIGPDRFDAGFWVDAIGRPDVRRIPFATGRIVDGISQFSPPVQFGRTYRDALDRSTFVAVYLHANAVDIEADGGGRTVRCVKIATLTGRTASVSAKVFVLATGGIENARLLLASNKVWPAGLGNHNDLVGRFFMDHPRVYSGWVRFRDAWARNRLYDHKYHYQSDAVAAHGIRVAAQLMLTPKTQAREGLLNAQLWFASIFVGEDSEAKYALMRLKRMVERRERPEQSLSRDLLTLLGHPVDSAGFALARLMQLRCLIKGCRLQAIVEPAPDPESRVTLSHQRDLLGMNRVRVNWRLDSLVKRTFDRNFALVADELSRAGVADVTLDPPIEGRDWPDSFEEEGTWHHIGTTRMHDSPKQGVVDRNCRVHGLSNLYIAGSSVFPTAGGNFPTITVVALALRLSEHVVGELRRPAAVLAAQAV